ncbi:unnamed protein product [Miscanthus lutarioriparius]|uniref:tryptophan--tRNA ligase n=1 Tax=Miscanthus lutarioriparius TaxID=422564 RepID=A0A811P8I3_9POAL|nr:unnamed protein product [Miscanthus lutarioriparius]
MEAGAQREATQPMLVVQEETPMVGVRPKDTEHETEAAAAAVELVVTQPEVLAPEGRTDYDKLVDLFGCQQIDAALVHRIARLASRPPHRFLRRGVFFFAHRDLNSGNMPTRVDPFLLNPPSTGPSGFDPFQPTKTLKPNARFMFTEYLQDAFKVPAVTVAECKRLARENAKDIIACGFDIQRTFIFTNISYTRRAFYENILEVAKRVTCEDSIRIIGGSQEDNIGIVSFPPVVAAPSLPSSFPHLFPRNDQPRCLIPCVIYRDPSFRMIRDVAPKIGFHKPSLIESKILPALQGEESSKMSASNPNSAIYKQIKTKVNKYAFSGGQSSVELHRKLGANLDVDVPIKYIEFFLEDDDEFEHIKKEYKDGRMLTGEVKQRLTAAISEMVSRHQRARAQVTEEMVDAFTAVRPLPNMFG